MDHPLHMFHAYILALAAERVNPARRYNKKEAYPDRRPERHHFKQFRRGSRNPGRANRHVFTNKDMRFW